MDSLDQIVLESLANACKVDRSVLSPDTTLTDVGFDSLGAAAFVSEMEFSHGIIIEPDDLPKLFLAVTPADVIAVVDTARAKTAHSSPVAAT
jgi:acyl carrier protein